MRQQEVECNKEEGGMRRDTRRNKINAKGSNWTKYLMLWLQKTSYQKLDLA